jgi:hypothetical protein
MKTLWIQTVLLHFRRKTTREEHPMNFMYKRLIFLIVTFSLFAIAGSAFALTSHSELSRSRVDQNPLRGITAAQGAAKGLEPAAAVTVGKIIAIGAGSLAGQNTAAARRLPSTIAGHGVYLIPSSTGDFCTYVDQIGEGCTRPLTSMKPATFAFFDRGDGSHPIVFGIAKDGVQSISFSLKGKLFTVPVAANVYALEIGSSVSFEDFTNVTASFTDGSKAALD